MNNLGVALLHLCRLQRHRINHHSVAFALESSLSEGGPEEQLSELWHRLEQAGAPLSLDALTPDRLPALVFHPQSGWSVAEALDAQGRLVVANGLGGQMAMDKERQRVLQSFVLPIQASRAGAMAWGMIKASVLQHRKTLVNAMVATGLVNLISLIVSIYSMQVYDRVIPTSGVATLTVLTIGAVLAAMFEFTLKWLRGHAIDQASAVVDCEVSNQLVSRLLGSRLDARPAQVGTLAAQVRGFDYIRGLMTSTTLFFAIDLPFGLLFIGVIALLGGVAVIAPIVVVATSIVLGLYAAKRVRRLSAQSLHNSNRKMGVLVEAIEAGETLKAGGGEWRLLGKWRHLVEQVAIDDLELKNHNSNISYIVALLQSVGYVAMIATGAVLAMDGYITTGALLACSILNGRAVSPLLQLPSLLLQWSQARSALQTLDQMLALPADASDESEQLTPDSCRGDIWSDDLGFGYAESSAASVALRAPLSVRAGSKVGIVGEVGSGKSTLLKLLAGLYEPQKGQVRLDGVDMRHLSPGFVRANLGYLAQDYRLVGGTLRENLTLGLADPGDASLLEACRATGLIQLINASPKGLALPISEGGRGVSGGQRQLIGLTRLFLANAKIWLLDEPTASLDGNSEGKILSMLRQQGSDRTMIVVTHKQSLLPLFDRLIVIVNGKVALDGPRDLVLAKLQGNADANQTVETN
ncbi:ATP-binding cassette domain-containing protein [Chromobacterium sphagni]|nr:ATP-binding cassette domain-containing protein [Chromobacterium sphagni]